MKTLGLKGGCLGPGPGLFLIIFGHFITVYLIPWCLWNGWKPVHHDIYWTITWFGKIRSSSLRLLQKTMMSRSVVSPCPFNSLHRFLDNNNISELPDKLFSDLTSLQNLWVYTWTIWCIVLFHALSNHFKSDFVIILLDKRRIRSWALLIAFVYQCAELRLRTTPSNSIPTYSPTWHLG